MKYLVVILLSLANLSGTSSSELPESNTEHIIQINACPETSDNDIFYINGILLASMKDTKKKQMLNMEGIAVERTEIESILSLGAQTPEALQDYWRKSGVAPVSDPEVCRSITNVLDADESVKSYTKDYERKYYTINNLYLIVYRPKKVKMSERKFPEPLIMNKKFKIIGKLN